MPFDVPVIRPLLSLAGIGLVCALLLAGAHALTEQAIENNRTAQAWRLAFDLTGERFDPSGRTWQGDLFRLPSGAWLCRASVQGYAGEIRLLAAFDGKGRLLGGRVTKHQETPGLGDFIDLDRSAWMLQFSTRSPLEVDAVTGATITSEAVKRGLSWMAEAMAAG